MKKMIKIILGTLAGVAFASTAMALPLLPGIPGDGPLYFKFNNYEQLSPSGSIATPDGNTEQNWGIVDITSIAVGRLVPDLPSGPPPINHQLFGRDNTQEVWTSGGGPGEITGIFYGIQPDPTNGVPVGSEVNVIASTGGFLDLYYDPNNDFNSIFDPSFVTGRTADDMYTGATEGTFLARIEFLNGAISAGNPNTSIKGTAILTPGGFDAGLADSFGGIVADVDGDGILYESGDDGAWAQFLDTNWFDSYLGLNTADFRFKNSYNNFQNWNGPGGSDIAGAVSDDPARVMAQPIPEPASMLLLGTGLAGLAGISRRRRKK